MSDEYDGLEPEEVELTAEDLDYLDFTGILPDTLLEHDCPYLSAVFLVDDVLKAETKQEAAYNLAVLIQYLCVERAANEQTMIKLYTTQQAMSYTPLILEYMLQMLGMAQAEVGRRILESEAEL
jgi:hypothetical protein